MELVKWRRWSNHGHHSSGSTAANSLCLAASNSSWNMSRYRTARVVSSTNSQLLTNYRAARHRPAFIFNPVKSSVKPHNTFGGEMKYLNVVSHVLTACPSCLGPTFFHGKNVVNGGVPVYAIVREYQDAWKTVDVVYHTFYPYNRGKQVCIGIRKLTDSRSGKTSFLIWMAYSGISTGKDKEKCLGNVESFGHHVGM